MKILFTLLLKQVYVDKGLQEQLIAAGYPRWEMVRPGRLTNGSMTGRYRVLDTLVEGMKVGAISQCRCGPVFSGSGRATDLPRQVSVH